MLQPVLARIVNTASMLTWLIAAPLAAQTGTPPSGVIAVSPTPTTVKLTWNRMTGGVGYPVGRNCTEVPPSGGCQAVSKALSATTTTWSDAGLQANTRYTYKVAVRYSDGKTGVAQVKATTTTMYASAVSAAKPLPPYVSTPPAPSPTPLPVLATLTTTGTHSFTGKFDNATDQWQHFRYSIVQGENFFCMPFIDSSSLK